MSVNENDERITYTLPSLFKLACLACTSFQYFTYSTKYKNLRMDVQLCCKELNSIIKENAVDGIFNPLGDRRHMYSKVVVAKEDLINSELLSSAIKHGHIECLKIAHEFGFPLTIMYVKTIFNYDIEVCQRKSKFKWVPDICSVAAFYGQLECLEYAHQQGAPWELSTCIAAILSGNFDCLKYAVKNGCLNGCDLKRYVIEAAAYEGRITMLKYLRERGWSWSKSICAEAAEGGQLECLMYLHSDGCPWDVSTCTAAVVARNFDCLKYAVENGCRLDTSEEPIIMAGHFGNLTFMKYLRENGCPWSRFACSSAASAGHYECLKYAHENGCPWDWMTTRNATIHGQLKCLKFAHQHKCPWNEETCIYALSSEQAKCLSYAWRNGCPWDDGTCFAGSGDGRMDCLLSEPDHDCQWDSEKFGGYAAVLRRTKPITSKHIKSLLIMCIVPHTS